MFYKSILELLALAVLFFDFEEEKYKKNAPQIHFGRFSKPHFSLSWGLKNLVYVNSFSIEVPFYSPVYLFFRDAVQFGSEQPQSQ
jgi:hypothetical protein